MRRRREQKHEVTGLIALVLFGVFAVCVLSVLLTGADVYHRLTVRDREAYARRTGIQYVATKVRQAQAGSAVAVSDFGGVDALERNLFVVRLMELVYDDGFMGFYAGNAALAYFDCAKEYARRGDAPKVRAFLEKTAKVAKQADATSGPDQGDKVLTYGATLLKGFADPAFRKITNYPGSLREDYRRRMIELSESVFAPYREADWFKEVISDLENG